MNIKLEDNKLYLPGLSTEDIKKVYHKFRIDLLDCNIVHYRPVSFNISNNALSQVNSNVSKIPGIGYSFAELSFILDNIILSEKKGKIFYELKNKIASTKLNSDCSYIVINKSESGKVEDDNILYAGEGITSIPRTLLKKVDILSQLKVKISIELVLLRGSGRRDFTDNQELIYDTSFKSMRTIYSLHQYFRLKEYTDGDYIELQYLEDINEDVLQDILINYFNEEVFSNVCS